MKIFVFGIGGTGSRVLRSLTMLLASGAKLKQDVEFIPIIVDLDSDNGDTLRTKKIVNDYREIKSLSNLNNYSEGFFHPKMRSLGSYSTNNNKNTIKDSFQLDFGHIDETFYRYIKGDQLDPINKNLLEALFDSSPAPKKGEVKSSPTELHLKLSLGFKGNPNIGSIVFNNLIHTNEYKYFENICTNEDKVFIISSIFGGTGSSGFPQLVKNLRNSDKEAVKNVHIGALVVMPYFLIGRDKESVIDANNFKSKTKAALSYYATELDELVNDTYYIGCDSTGDAYKNVEGGREQINKAHIVELLGAKSIVHFANLNQNNRNKNNFAAHGFHYYEYGIKTETKNIDFRHFYHNETEDNIELLKFTYFAKFMKEDLNSDRALKAGFAKRLNINSQTLGSDKFYTLLRSFLVDEYYTWLQELEQNTPSFQPFNFSEDYRSFVKNIEASRLKDRSFIDRLSKFTGRNEKITNRYECFLRSIYQACDHAFNERVKQLPTDEFQNH